jgi:hypothetical protein
MGARTRIDETAIIDSTGVFRMEFLRRRRDHSCHAKSVNFGLHNSLQLLISYFPLSVHPPAANRFSISSISG